MQVQHDLMDDSQPRWLREVVSQGLLLILLLGVLFPGVFLRGEVASGADLLFRTAPWSAQAPANRVDADNPIMSDIVAAMTPYYAATAQSLAQDQWPLWNPLEMSGLPLLANGQSAVLYPPRLLHVVLDLPHATSWYFLLKLWLCGMTAFLCARGIGMGPLAARVASVAWAFNTFNGVWCYWPLPDVSAWLPILFYGVEMAARGRLRASIFGVASGGALMLLAGHPESAFAQALGAGVYLLLRLGLSWTGPREFVRAAGICLGGWVLALLLTAAQWLPLVEYILHSYTLNERSGEDYGNYIPPMGAVTFFIPRFLGTNAERNLWGDHTHNLYSYYSGVLVLIAVGLALPLLTCRRTRPMAGGLLGACLICVLWAFAMPGLSAIFKLPGLHALRINYNIAFAVFAMTMLGAQGLEHFIRTPRRASAWVGAGGMVLLGVGVVSLCYNFNFDYLRMSGHLAYVQRQMATGAVVLVFSLVLLALATRARFAHAAGWGLLSLLIVDLIWALHGINPTMPPKLAYPPTALTDHLRSLPKPARVQVGTGYIPSGLMVPYGVEDWLGYDGLYPERIMRFTKAMGQQIWTSAEPICSTPWYLRNPAFAKAGASSMFHAAEQFPVTDTKRFELVTTLDGIEVYRNKLALPRAYVAGAVTTLPDSTAVFQSLMREDFVPGTVVYTAEPPAAALPSKVGIAGNAEVTSLTPNQVEIRVKAERPAALVLSDAYYPGWRATVNDVETPIFPAYHAFRAVLIPEGESRVVFHYFPPSLKIGLALSVVGMIAGSALALWSLRRAIP